MEWIKVSERLPEVGVSVMVYTITDGFIPFMKLQENGEWISECFRWGGGVTHWQPLPDPPKGE